MLFLPNYIWHPENDRLHLRILMPRFSVFCEWHQP